VRRRPSLMTDTPNRVERMRRIANDVARRLGVPYDRVVATRETRQRRYRAPLVVLARQVAMWLARQLLGASYPEVGRFFHVDHTTVISACRRVEATPLPPEVEAIVSTVLFGNAARWGHA
jgi:chromosomal replication initiation ATPase DnaA